ncbi:HPr family phosphocarrier protein [Xanthobacter sp. V4C-4]|uniref:HPr family phosphocarrier protein n=1 Tax=Xanthobacter cornucopiae TaxID=3119924 RepID=UPI003728A320
MSQAASSLVNDAFDPVTAEDPAEACGCAIRADAEVRVLPIVNKRGLHARASAKFVQTVEQYDARVSVCRSGEEVCGNSIMGLMMLAASPGTAVTVTATGREATAVLDALTALVADRFGEEE